MPDHRDFIAHEADNVISGLPGSDDAGLLAGRHLGEGVRFLYCVPNFHVTHCFQIVPE